MPQCLARQPIGQVPALPCLALVQVCKAVVGRGVAEIHEFHDIAGRRGVVRPLEQEGGQLARYAQCRLGHAHGHAVAGNGVQRLPDRPAAPAVRQ